MSFLCQTHISTVSALHNLASPYKNSLLFRIFHWSSKTIFNFQRDSIGHFFNCKRWRISLCFPHVKNNSCKQSNCASNFSRNALFIPLCASDVIDVSFYATAQKPPFCVIWIWATSANIGKIIRVLLTVFIPFLFTYSIAVNEVLYGLSIWIGKLS